MKEKSNESTPQRPEGERAIDAALVSLDLTHYMEEIKKESTWKDSDRNANAPPHGIWNNQSADSGRAYPFSNGPAICGFEKRPGHRTS